MTVPCGSPQVARKGCGTFGALARASSTRVEPARQSLSVAVVGGGAAGLISARELLCAGHRVSVLERSSNIGGVWDYTEEVEDNPLGQGQHRVHGSMYAQLRTNLPREVMGLPNFPFDASFKGSQDPRQFPGHAEVQRYLEAFAEEYGLLQHVRFGTEVQRVLPVQPATGSSEGAATHGWLRWEVTTRSTQHQDHSTSSSDSSTSTSSSSSSSSKSSSRTEQYDAVVVANGHYSRPRLPQIPGQDVFPGLQMHSHNYRRPEPFKNKMVVLLGASASGVDIAEEIALAGAKQVYLCARVWENPLTGQALSIDDSDIKFQGKSLQQAGSSGASHGCQVAKAPNLRELHHDGSVSLADGSHIANVDVVMYCTGYVYDFPFLSRSGFVRVEDNRVGPLYQHVFPPAAAPTLSFVGLTWKVIPFPQFQLQSRWIARVLAGSAQLPSLGEMERDIAGFYASLKTSGIPVRYTHRQSDGVQWQYNRWLAQQCGEEHPSEWREAMYTACGISRKLNAGRYRDVPLPGAAEAEQAAREEAARVRQQSMAAATA